MHRGPLSGFERASALLHRGWYQCAAADRDAYIKAEGIMSAFLMATTKCSGEECDPEDVGYYAGRAYALADELEAM